MWEAGEPTNSSQSGGEHPQKLFWETGEGSPVSLDKFVFPTTQDAAPVPLFPKMEVTGLCLWLRPLTFGQGP